MIKAAVSNIENKAEDVLLSKFVLAEKAAVHNTWDQFPLPVNRSFSTYLSSTFGSYIGVSDMVFVKHLSLCLNLLTTRE